MVRSCFACRKRYSPEKLVRLQIKQDRLVEICTDKKTFQRSAWLCLDPKCIKKLQKKPKILEKSLRQRNLEIEDLDGQVNRYFLQKTKERLRLISHSGRILCGQAKVAKNTDKIEVILISKQQKKHEWKEIFQQKPVYSIPISSKELGDWIGKGPRKVIGILSNRHLQKLNDYLQLWGRLR